MQFISSFVVYLVSSKKENEMVDVDRRQLVEEKKFFLEELVFTNTDLFFL